MPNGGTDSCGRCAHNRAIQDGILPQPREDTAFWDQSFCTLRQVKVANPFWTYCDNATHIGGDPARLARTTAIGFIQAAGLYDGGYTRIPWDGVYEPYQGTGGPCTICGTLVERSLCLERDDGRYTFCSNDHYLRWWQGQHPLR